jgi:hypothetical protein
VTSAEKMAGRFRSSQLGNCKSRFQTYVPLYILPAHHSIQTFRSVYYYYSMRFFVSKIPDGPIRERTCNTITLTADNNILIHQHLMLQDLWSEQDKDLWTRLMTWKACVHNVHVMYRRRPFVALHALHCNCKCKTGAARPPWHTFSASFSTPLGIFSEFWKI